MAISPPSFREPTGKQAPSTRPPKKPPPTLPPTPKLSSISINSSGGDGNLTAAPLERVALLEHLETSQFETNHGRTGYLRPLLWCSCFAALIGEGGATSLSLASVDPSSYMMPWAIAASLFVVYGIMTAPAPLKVGGPVWPSLGYEAKVQATAEALMLEALSYGTNAMYDLGWPPLYLRA